MEDDEDSIWKRKDYKKGMELHRLLNKGNLNEVFQIITSSGTLKNGGFVIITLACRQKEFKKVWNKIDKKSKKDFL